MEKTIKLSQAQQRAMAWIGKGWSAIPSHGDVYTINGKTVLLTTLRKLESYGLIERGDHKVYERTEKGKKLTYDRGL